MELLATLSDVAADGRSTIVTHGALIGSMRETDASATWVDKSGLVEKPSHPYTKDTYLTPGETQRFDVGLLPTTWAIEPGHSLRLVVATQAGASDCVITLSPLPQAWPCIYTAPQKNTLPGGKYRLQYGGAAASSVALPLVDPTALPTARSAVTATSDGQTEPLDWGTLAAASPRTATNNNTTSRTAGGSSSSWLWVAVVVALVAIVCGLTIWMLRRRRVA